MKKMILCGALFLSAILFNDARSQVRVNINIGSQPVWGPVGYDYVEYYYLPDIETYYYVPTRQFVYLSSNGTWIHSYSLPPAYRSYDLYTGYKVVVNQPRAYLGFKSHKAKYDNYRKNHSQVIIRNSDQPKYYVVKGHPKHKAVNKHNNKGKNKGKHRR